MMAQNVALRGWRSTLELSRRRDFSTMRVPFAWDCYPFMMAWRARDSLPLAPTHSHKLQKAKEKAERNLRANEPNQTNSYSDNSMTVTRGEGGEGGQIHGDGGKETLGAEHTTQCTEGVLLNSTPETCMLLTNVTPINLILKKEKEREKEVKK